MKNGSILHSLTPKLDILRGLVYLHVEASKTVPLVTNIVTEPLFIIGEKRPSLLGIHNRIYLIVSFDFSVKRLGFFQITLLYEIMSNHVQVTNIDFIRCVLFGAL